MELQSLTVDPQVQALLDQFAQFPWPSENNLSSEQIRQAYLKLRSLAGSPEDIDKVEEIKLPGATGSIPVRIYTPKVGKTLPILVYFHGGRYISGDLDTHDAPLRALANRSECIIVSVGYRLAPEYKFPGAVDDSYSVTKWIADHASDIGGDPTRIAVSGDSAGGGIAAAVTLIAREKNSPALAYQILIYPMLDATISSKSYKSFATGYLMTAEMLISGYTKYLPENVDPKNPYISPLWSKDLKNLPPAYVLTAEFDPLRDEGEAYAKRLKEAGVPVILKRYEGMIHGFFQFGGVLDVGRKSIDETASALREAFAK